MISGRLLLVSVFGILPTERVRADGAPVLEFSSALKILLREKKIRHSHLSLSDEREIAAATVILECED